MKKILILFLLLFSISPLQAQIKNIVYVDASSDVATFTRDDWQESLEETLAGLDRLETLVFISNKKSPIICSPDEYINTVRQLGTVRPDQPLVDEDLRLLVEALDKFSISSDMNLIVYTSNEALQQNVDLGRLLFERIGFLLLDSVDNVELNYFLHRSDTSAVLTTPNFKDFNQTTTYF